MKKGELTTQQIVMLIILITSFVIILFLLFRLNFGETTEKEICHNSVVLKGNSQLPDNALSLDCKTSYICISKDGSCDKMKNSEIKKVASDEEVYQILADELADCWWMFGEGKIDYVQKDLISNLYCSLCSQIAFDESVKEIPGFEEGIFNQKDLYDFMSKEKLSGGEKTYLEYLMGLQEAEKIREELVKTEVGSGGVDFPKIILDNYYYVVMGISSKISKLQWGALAGTVGLVTAIIFPGGLIVGAVIVGASFIAGREVPTLLGVFVKGDSGNEYLSPTIIEANSKEFNELECKEIVTKA
ncbi:hypothetical protein KAJ87_02530 [Candidatus Pacearchaeota archaeon]|nr:hypothetical protein [Candidatus Pacearchaeota archaeon]